MAYRYSTLAAAAPVVLFCLAALAGDVRPFMNSEESGCVADALAVLNAVPSDMGFDKDHVEQQVVLQRVIRILAEPLELTALADDVLACARDEAIGGRRAALRTLLEVAPDPGAPALMPGDRLAVPPGGPWPDGLDRVLSGALQTFVSDAGRLAGRVQDAFGAISPEERQEMGAYLMADLFNAEDPGRERAAILAMGLTSNGLARAVLNGLELDPEPAARAFLASIERIDMGALIDAACGLRAAVEGLAGAVTDGVSWPEQALDVTTPMGRIRVGTRQRDIHEGAYLLVLDPGGADLYRGDAGVANGLLDSPLAAIVDLDGDDRYEGEGILGPASALFGVSIVLDRAGNDTYIAAHTGQAAGFFGAAILADGDGGDVYRAAAVAQGAAYGGVGILEDTRGNDLYDVGLQGQGFAGVRAVGLLVDRHGNDVYRAGSREPDYGRYPNRFLSLSQGFAIGLRPFAGGGIAALVDLTGDDSYEADVFGQGASYWYSAAMLLDMAGNDTYRVYQYGQGAGIHLSAGLLADGGGDDVYRGYALTQGSAHDYGVGLLLDRGGDDLYAVDHESQGRAINNSLAVLLDGAGNDIYLALGNEDAQGIGHDGGRREYGSLSLLLDLAGRDRYSCGARDGSRLERPDFGIVYDRDEP